MCYTIIVPREGALNPWAMEGSQHQPCEYQIMCVGDFYKIDSNCGRTIVSKGNNVKKRCS